MFSEIRLDNRKRPRLPHLSERQRSRLIELEHERANVLKSKDNKLDAVPKQKKRAWEEVNNFLHVFFRV